MSEQRGPIEDLPWPSVLTARVVDCGSPTRLYGFAVHADLAKHYRFSDVIYLTLTGELPTDVHSRWFCVALTLLSPARVNEAPAHAAMLARLCGSRTSGVIATGAVALAEQARFLLHEHAELLEWLIHPRDQLPVGFRAADDGERAEVAAVLDALGSEAAKKIRTADPSLVSLFLCVLVECGIVSHERLEAAICIARLPCVIAEALAARPGDFRGYPMNLPSFEYVGGERP
jgi:hypothetical protein